jgi:hypothetical protein
MIPLLDMPMEVHVARNAEGDPHVCGCSRYWGELYCEGACEERAIAAFHAMQTSETPAPDPPVYCGHPNLAAPRPREAPAAAEVMGMSD